MKSLLTYIMLKINNLRKNFGEKTAVDIDNFTVNNGDILGLVGNNGAGKTTLFRLILDLLKDSLYSHATANWGGEWRMPTNADIEELIANTTNKWMTLNGVNGREVKPTIDNNQSLTV